MHRSLPFFALLGALACSRSAAHGNAETPVPGVAATPMERCVDQALEASSLVDASFAPNRQWGASRAGRRMRGVRLMNPPGPRIQSVGFAVESPSGTPRTFVVEYSTPGQGGMQPAPDPQLSDLERQAVAEIGAQLLREVRAACMPSAVGQPTCFMVRQGSVGRCTIGT